mmetsp:Transcript_3157/g.3517  ORF Transcript_3157/g.3517 Transcript_3157/m.3517 type:complete len:85 (-) Transcript_3157:203-457(-)
MTNSVNVAFDMHQTPDNPNDTILRSTCNHQDERNGKRDETRRADPDSKPSPSENTRCRGHLWCLSSLSRYPLGHSTGKRNDNQM